MALLYHFHKIVGTSTGNCAGNTHDPSCGNALFAGSTEVACNQRSNSPINRPCRCVHEVPNNFKVPRDIGFEVWVAPNRRKAGKVSRPRGAKKKVPARKK